ncbi:MAG: WxL domain-containing protein, partial [Streptococcaceae bacterium]|nr:WxL domain-containing protein [Streptococcaceae bacterium]
EPKQTEEYLEVVNVADFQEFSQAFTNPNVKEIILNATIQLENTLQARVGNLVINAQRYDLIKNMQEVQLNVDGDLTIKNLQAITGATSQLPFIAITGDLHFLSESVEETSLNIGINSLATAQNIHLENQQFILNNHSINSNFLTAQNLIHLNNTKIPSFTLNNGKLFSTPNLKINNSILTGTMIGSGLFWEATANVIQTGSLIIEDNAKITIEKNAGNLEVIKTPTSFNQLDINISGASSLEITSTNANQGIVVSLQARTLNFTVDTSAKFIVNTYNTQSTQATVLLEGEVTLAVKTSGEFTINRGQQNQKNSGAGPTLQINGNYERKMNVNTQGQLLLRHWGTGQTAPNTNSTLLLGPISKPSTITLKDIDSRINFYAESGESIWSYGSVTLEQTLGFFEMWARPHYTSSLSTSSGTISVGQSDFINMSITQPQHFDFWNITQSLINYTATNDGLFHNRGNNVGSRRIAFYDTGVQAWGRYSFDVDYTQKQTPQGQLNPGPLFNNSNVTSLIIETYQVFLNGGANSIVGNGWAQGEGIYALAPKGNQSALGYTTRLGSSNMRAEVNIPKIRTIRQPTNADKTIALGLYQEHTSSYPWLATQPKPTDIPFTNPGVYMSAIVNDNNQSRLLQLEESYVEDDWHYFKLTPEEFLIAQSTISITDVSKVIDTNTICFLDKSEPIHLKPVLDVIPPKTIEFTNDLLNPTDNHDHQRLIRTIPEDITKLSGTSEIGSYVFLKRYNENGIPELISEVIASKNGSWEIDFGKHLLPGVTLQDEDKIAVVLIDNSQTSPDDLGENAWNRLDHTELIDRVIQQVNGINYGNLQIIPEITENMYHYPSDWLDRRISDANYRQFGLATVLQIEKSGQLTLTVPSFHFGRHMITNQKQILPPVANGVDNALTIDDTRTKSLRGDWVLQVSVGEFFFRSDVERKNSLKGAKIILPNEIILNSDNSSQIVASWFLTTPQTPSSWELTQEELQEKTRLIIPENTPLHAQRYRSILTWTLSGQLP